VTGPHPLDNPVWSSLAGPHARFAQRRGNALRYPADVSPFAALPDQPDAADWADLAALAGPGSVVGLAGVRVPPPAGWTVTPVGEGVQLVDACVEVASDGEAVRLGPADVPEMLGLARRTRPGPFLPRTRELGVYLGIRRGGALVAMAGERLHPPGWTEISAVCTDERWRGHGFASRLVRVLVAGVRARREIPFLHALASNTDAIGLYEAMGFRLRRTMMFSAVRTPPPSPPPDDPHGR
jgi:ribosomal protein S18 acetylase RimI-like enzyme